MTITPLCRPVTTRYAYRRPLPTLARRVRRSQFAADVSSAWRATFWVRVVASGLLIGLYLVATSHVYLDWTGFHNINGGIR